MKTFFKVIFILFFILLFLFALGVGGFFYFQPALKKTGLICNFCLLYKGTKCKYSFKKKSWACLIPKKRKRRVRRKKRRGRTFKRRQRRNRKVRGLYTLSIHIRVNERKPNGSYWDPYQTKKNSWEGYLGQRYHLPDTRGYIQVGGERIGLRAISNGLKAKWYSKQQILSLKGNESIFARIEDDDENGQFDLIGTCHSRLRGLNRRRTVIRLKCGFSKLKLVFLSVRR